MGGIRTSADNLYEAKGCGRLAADLGSERDERL